MATGTATGWGFKWERLSSVAKEVRVWGEEEEEWEEEAKVMEVLLAWVSFPVLLLRSN